MQKGKDHIAKSDGLFPFIVGRRLSSVYKQKDFFSFWGDESEKKKKGWKA